jgi:pyruvate kinase
MRTVDDVLISTGRASHGDVVVVTAGAPPGVAGSTNNVRVHTIGAIDGS